VIAGMPMRMTTSRAVHAIDQQSLHNKVERLSTCLPTRFHDSPNQERQDARLAPVETNAGGPTLLLDDGVESVCITAMRNNFFTTLALTCLVFWSAGCVTTEKGDLKFGMPGRDTIVSRYEAPYDRVKAAAIAVLKRNGTLVGDDLVKKVLEARIDNASVFVSLDDSEPKITKINVQVRRGASADVDMASELQKQIYGELITH